jgi:hypothetical protein
MPIGNSPYALAGVFRVSLYFSGVEFPFTKESHIAILHMSESSKLEIPMIRLQFTDGIQFFKNNPGLLVEASQIEIALLAREVASATYKFRVNSLHVSPSKMGDVVDIDGYLDFPRYWIQTTNAVYKSLTSGDLLKQLATQSGLTYDGDVTSDQQTWHGGAKRIHAFCNEIANHGFSSDTSCMKLAVCFDGTMRYKDISKLDVNEPVAKMLISDIRQGYITVVSHQPKNSGGSANRKAGYKKTATEYSVVRDTPYRTHTNIAADINEGGEFNMNQDVRDLVESGAHQCYAIDYGNVHDNYNRSRYQNIRGTALFNVGLDILINMPAIENPKVSVFDTINITAPAEQSELNGSYIVVSHAISITNSQYHEKFELTRRSAASDQSKKASDNVKFEPISTPLYQDS